MNIKDFEVGVASYCKDKVMPKLTSSWDRLVLGAFIGALGLRFETLIQNIYPAVVSAGIIDANGNIDLDMLEKIGNSGFEYQPTLEIWKLKFSGEDFKDFIAHLRK